MTLYFKSFIVGTTISDIDSSLHYDVLQVLNVYFLVRKSVDLYQSKVTPVALQWMVLKYLHLVLTWMKRYCLIRGIFIK